MNNIKIFQSNSVLKWPSLNTDIKFYRVYTLFTIYYILVYNTIKINKLKKVYRFS